MSGVGVTETELLDGDITGHGLVLTETAPGVTVAEIRSSTGVELAVAEEPDTVGESTG